MLIIGIAGGTGSGKTTVVHQIMNELPSSEVGIISQDSYYKETNNLSYEERIMQLDLNPDRADVIIPATKIYLSIMEWSGANKIFVPKIGLADGIVKQLYFEK